MQSFLQMWLTRHPQLQGSFLRLPKVHAGFLKSWHSNALNAVVLAYLRGLLDSGEVHRSTVTIYTTGHSLGNA